MKILLYQGGGEYASLHIMITDNPKMMDGKLRCKSTEDALQKIERWLKEKMK